MTERAGHRRQGRAPEGRERRLGQWPGASSHRPRGRLRPPPAPWRSRSAWSGPPRCARARRARSRRRCSSPRSCRSSRRSLIVLSLLRETISFFGDVPIQDYLFGDKWTPLLRGDQQSFGVIPIIWGTLYLTGIGLLVAIPLGLLCAIYLSEYATHAGPQGRQADPRDAGRRPDHRLRLLRAHLLHAERHPRARVRRQPVQRAVGRDHPRACSSCRRSRRWPRTRCRPCPPRCARARSGSAPPSCRSPCGSSSRPPSRASWPRSSSAPRAPSARP